MLGIDVFYVFVIMHLGVVVFDCFFFFFKQKTAYEMRISDWSSDVCSSDLVRYLPAWQVSNGWHSPPRAGLEGRYRTLVAAGLVAKGPVQCPAAASFVDHRTHHCTARPCGTPAP